MNQVQPQQYGQPQQFTQHAPTPGYNVQVNSGSPVIVVPSQEKSMGVALLLTFFFGPLGLLYVRVLSAILWMAVSIVLIPLTFGLALPLIWVLCMLDSLLATGSYNRKMRRRMIAMQQQIVAQQQAQLQAQQHANWAAQQQPNAPHGQPLPQPQR